MCDGGAINVHQYMCVCTVRQFPPPSADVTAFTLSDPSAPPKRLTTAQTSGVVFDERDSV